MDFIYGFTYNSISTILVQPLDCIKTLYQVQKNTSIVSSIQNHYTKHTIRGFYKGLVPNICTYPMFWGIFFQLQEISIISKYCNNPFITSYIYGNIASTFTNPLFVIKTRFQTYNQPRDIICRDIYRNISSLWKGVPATYINNLKLGIQFPLYDILKKETNNNIIVSSIISKLVSSSLLYPMDLMRVQQRNSTLPLSLYTISKNIYKEYGIRGFMKGIVLYNSVSLCNFTIMMVCKEYFSKEYFSK